MALWECGYKPQGVRIDSGDLAYYSRLTRQHFKMISKKYIIINEIMLKKDIKYHFLRKFVLQQVIMLEQQY